MTVLTKAVAYRIFSENSTVIFLKKIAIYHCRQWENLNTLFLMLLPVIILFQLSVNVTRCDTSQKTCKSYLLGYYEIPRYHITLKSEINKYLCIEHSCAQLMHHNCVFP